MKPWLFDILACPIDKNYPLKLYIFSYETKNDEFEAILNICEKKDLKQIKIENIVKIYQEKGNFLIQDNIILKKTSLNPYLELISQSINELNNIFDQSGMERSKNLLENIKTVIYQKIREFIKHSEKIDIDEILPELVTINKYKFEIEIKTGIIFCPQCNRWFPIIDTIPQMLPDEYRDEKEEIEFLKMNKNLLNKEFFQQDLKPYNYKNLN